MLEAYPVEWATPQVRQLLQILSTTFYRTSDIESIAAESGLPLSDLSWGSRPRDTWRSVFELAAGQGMVDSLLNAVADRAPALRIRLDELRGPQPVLAMDGSASADSVGGRADAPGWKNFSPDGRAEAIIVAGQPSFLDVSFLAVGLARSRGICRLVTHFPAEGSATGVRVGDRHLLTNYHVLFNSGDANRRVIQVQAWFNYESDEQGELRKVHRIRCDPASIVGERADDWALLRTCEPIPERFPALPIVGAPVPIVDDRVYIIQHPQGQPKKVAFQHNLVRSVNAETIQYWTDTDLGSSGSPVFDEAWRIVALHHYSVPAPPGDRIAVRNQGRRIDRIVERMRSHGLDPEDLV